MERPALATHRARALRRDMTDVERWLWGKLRDRRLGGYKFVRQMPIGPFFADFGCREAKLIVELDGSQHAANRRDDLRDAFLVGQGYGVLRFWNREVVRGIADVCETILAAVEGRLEAHDRYRAAPAQSPSSGPSGHLLPLSREKGRSPRKPTP
jgi:very-short-patch-repair endonuclease